MLRPQADSFIVIGDGFIELVHQIAHDTAIHVSLCVGRIEPDCLGE